MDRNDIVEAMSDTMVWRTLDPGKKGQVIESAIARAYNMKGQTAIKSGEVYYFTREQLYNVLDKRYSHLTASELNLVIDCGTRGEFGKDTFVNLANIEQWLKAYHNDPDRLKVYEERYKEANQREDTMTEEEKNNAMYDKRMKEVFAYFCETGDIFQAEGGNDPRAINTPEFGEVLYKLMEQKGHAVKFTPESYDTMKAQAEEMLKDYRATVRFRVSDGDADMFYNCILLRENFRYQKTKREQTNITNN